MPQIIQDVDEFDLNLSDKNALDTRLFLMKKPSSLTVGPFHLWKSGHRIRLLDTTRTQTLYHVKYEVHRKKLWINETHSVQQAVQVQVWRKPGEPSTTGLAKAVFFDFLVPQYGAIFSDTYHTADGKRFWLDRLAEAFNLGHRVFWGNFGEHRVIELKTMNDIYNSYALLIWGDEPSKTYQRVLITPR